MKKMILLATVFCITQLMMSLLVASEQSDEVLLFPAFVERCGQVSDKVDPADQALTGRPPKEVRVMVITPNDQGLLHVPVQFCVVKGHGLNRQDSLEQHSARQACMPKPSKRYVSLAEQERYWQENDGSILSRDNPSRRVFEK